MNVASMKNGTPTQAPKRMSLAHTRDGVIASPMRILIYGGEKVGKSTFASGAPSPVWLGADAGTDHLNIRRLPQPETLKDVLDGIDEVTANGKGAGIGTLVVDPLNWIEALVVADVVGDSGKSLAEWGGGYGRGPSAAIDRWRLIKNALERCWAAGFHVVICAHAHVKKFEDPEGTGYERYELAMQKEAAGLFKQWVDAILFAKRESYGKVDPNTKKAKAYGSAARLLYTEWTPAYDAGNRWCLPPELPLSWPSFVEALDQGAVRRREALAQIEAGLAELGDKATETKVRAWLADPNANVIAIAGAVASKVDEKKKLETKEG
jgi:hypothetical protein